MTPDLASLILLQHPGILEHLHHTLHATLIERLAAVNKFHPEALIHLEKEDK